MIFFILISFENFSLLNLLILNKKSMNIRNFIERIRRVLLVSTKPDKEEFKQSVKITGLGILFIGIIGFVVFLIIQFVGGL